MERVANHPAMSIGNGFHLPLTKIYKEELLGLIEDRDPKVATREHVFPVMENMSNAIVSWSFDVFDHSEDELLALAKQMFSHFDFFELFSIEPEVLEKFLIAVRKHYNRNPYHNWRHAFDVAQASFCFLVQFHGRDSLTDLDILSLLVASLCHDLAHPGVNNDFMIKTASDISILYNDQSVLENLHCCLLFKMTNSHPEINIFASLTNQDFKYVRRAIVGCILATDLAMHSSYVSQLSAKVDSGANWNKDREAERLLLLKCIIKMADIGNVARKWDGPGFKWGCCISEEFFCQGDLEKAMGIDVANFNDRTATSLHKNTIGFIDFIVAPFFTKLGMLHPEFDEIVVNLLRSNREICLRK
jgi:hypothetical protein